MTTVVISVGSKEIFTDSQRTTENSKTGEVTKITLGISKFFDLNNGVVGVLAGQEEFRLNWLIPIFKHFGVWIPLDFFRKESKADIAFFRGDTLYIYQSHKFKPIKVTGDRWVTMGSGGKFAARAVHKHKVSYPTAVKYAMYLDEFSGGHVQYYKA